MIDIWYAGVGLGLIAIGAIGMKLKQGTKCTRHCYKYIVIKSKANNAEIEQILTDQQKHLLLYCEKCGKVIYCENKLR